MGIIRAFAKSAIALGQNKAFGGWGRNC